MQSKAKSVPEYLDSLPADRRAAIEAVRAVVRQNLDPQLEEGMQYGMIGYYVPHRVYPAGYKCDPKQPLPFAHIASQKNHMAVYLFCMYGDEAHRRWFEDAWKKSGKRLEAGKSCIRFKKLDDLALDVIGESIRRVTVAGFIKRYETVFKAPSGKRAAKPAKAAGKNRKARPR